jgi:hypothetical protein
VMLFRSFLKACLIIYIFHLNFTANWNLLCCFPYSLLVTVYGHHVLNTLRRHRLKIVHNLLMVSCVTFQVSHPHNNTLKTLLLNILSFVLLRILCDAHEYVLINRYWSSYMG